MENQGLMPENLMKLIKKNYLCPRAVTLVTGDWGN
ncbi:MAG: hypothetical protein RLZZ568_665 [Cyanobacteriota bacterium]|jgi:hypothetical protein